MQDSVNTRADALVKKKEKNKNKNMRFLQIFEQENV